MTIGLAISTQPHDGLKLKFAFLIGRPPSEGARDDDTVGIMSAAFALATV